MKYLNCGNDSFLFFNILLFNINNKPEPALLERHYIKFIIVIVKQHLLATYCGSFFGNRRIVMKHSILCPVDDLVSLEVDKNYPFRIQKCMAGLGKRLDLQCRRIPTIPALLVLPFRFQHIVLSQVSSILTKLRKNSIHLSFMSLKLSLENRKFSLF